MTDNQKQFLNELIEHLKNENNFEGKEYNIPFMILPLEEKFESDKEFMRDIVNNQYCLNYFKDYKFYDEINTEVIINIVNIEAEYNTDYEDYYYILRFSETGAYHDYDGELFGCEPIIEVDKCECLESYKTVKTDDEIDEYVNNYLKNNSDEYIKVKLLEIEKLESNMIELRKEIIKKKLELGDVK